MEIKKLKENFFKDLLKKGFTETTIVTHRKNIEFIPEEILLDIDRIIEYLKENFNNTNKTDVNKMIATLKRLFSYLYKNSDISKYKEAKLKLLHYKELVSK
ncbi:hypothetical protein EV215_0504 [Hypnocyclicus thermotrophus]|uniref:Uncharacterized protein n=1 Tax=Hypnocyclicus thermotrophus TaxID=1627895 RepID=A0AA46I6I2_9FUSO|nr:hypothetical protein [Hypnocyclicus thermotrophus]TDT71816.1 hypothetical protein EV215_0504 [Hypnocyclicus thermotrophus]